MEKEMLLYWTSAVTLALLGSLLSRIFVNFWWKPLQLKKCFESQGIQVLPYKFFVGNARDMIKMVDEALSTPMASPSHDTFHRVVPYLSSWIKTYGKEFVYWVGSNPRLYVAEPDLIKQILLDKDGSFALKVHHPNPLVQQLLGGGLPNLMTGDVWAKHRKIINPAFHVDRLKSMIPAMAEGCAIMLKAWSEQMLNDAAELEVSKEFLKLSADIICRTAFGSSSQEGKHICSLANQQLTVAANLFLSPYVPGLRFVPTKTNRECRRLENEIRNRIKNIIFSRANKTTCDDLLGLMLAANNNQDGIDNSKMVLDELIDECKTFYLAGHETTAGLLTWSMILLAMHRDWQEKARNEVLQVCGKDDLPNAESISCLHIVGMILNEVSRLYPAASTITRETTKPTTLGNMFIPAGTQVEIAILPLQQETQFWGEDAKEFNPARFSQGVVKAVKHPLAFLPFSFGPRICIGQNFALIQAKVVVAMILQKFSFELSPSYVHAPVPFLTGRPQHGGQVILRMI